MHTRIAVGLGVVIVAAVLLWPRPAERLAPPVAAGDAPTRPSPPSAEDSGIVRGATQAASAAPRSAAAALPARARRIPPYAAPDGSVEPRPRIRLAPAAGALRDKRGASGERDPAATLELVRGGLDTIRDDVEACLEAWRASDARAEGQVTITFQIDEAGLTDSWVAGQEQLPFGVSTCFATAVHGVDWSNIVESPAEISERYTLEMEDAGP